MTHKSEDYKISAVKYYLKNKDNIRKNSSTGLDEPVKPKFTRFEISKPC